jgi:D-tyrosyl-tRNA(Tyr) deacylase
LRAVIQRVSKAEVRVDGRVVGSIGPGILTLLGVGSGDTPQVAEKLVSKIVKLRIFADEQGRMNRSIQDISGGHLIVSQFTLYGDLSKGNRPSFIGAGDPATAKAIYEHAVSFSRSLGIETSSGEFQADMKVELVNDGPATFLLEMQEGQ